VPAYKMVGTAVPVSASDLASGRFYLTLLVLLVCMIAIIVYFTSRSKRVG